MVSIPKKAGGERVLGVPTVSDRIAQMVVRQMIEPELETIFLPDSYGYRPGKSALDAVGVTRVSGAGNMTGFWNSTSKGCLAIFRTIFC
jgi:retron-type reverse transcriptase